MPRLVIKENDHNISNKRVKVTASIILRPRSTMSDAELEERVTFAQQLASGLRQIEIPNALTGEIDIVPVARVTSAFATLNFDEMYLEVNSHIATLQDDDSSLTVEEIRQERRRHGLGN
jgi:hypothetical protein